MLYYPSIDKAHFHVDLDIHCPGLRIGVVNGSHIQLFGNDLKHLNFDHSMSTNSEIWFKPDYITMTIDNDSELQWSNIEIWK